MVYHLFSSCFWDDLAILVDDGMTQCECFDLDPSTKHVKYFLINTIAFIFLKWTKMIGYKYGRYEDEMTGVWNKRMQNHRSSRNHTNKTINLSPLYVSTYCVHKCVNSMDHKSQSCFCSSNGRIDHYEWSHDYLKTVLSNAAYDHLKLCNVHMSVLGWKQI